MDKQVELTVSQETVTSSEEKLTLLGAAGVFDSMIEEAAKEGNQEFAKACYFARQSLEQMVRGTLPIFKFDQPEEALKLFEQSTDQVGEALRQREAELQTK